MNTDSDAFLSPPEESDDEKTIELEEQIQLKVCICTYVCSIHVASRCVYFISLLN